MPGETRIKKPCKALGLRKAFSLITAHSLSASPACIVDFGSLSDFRSLALATASPTHVRSRTDTNWKLRRVIRKNTFLRNVVLKDTFLRNVILKDTFLRNVVLNHQLWTVRDIHRVAAVNLQVIGDGVIIVVLGEAQAELSDAHPVDNDEVSRGE